MSVEKEYLGINIFNIFLQLFENVTKVAISLNEFLKHIINHFPQKISRQTYLF